MKLALCGALATRVRADLVKKVREGQLYPSHNTCLAGVSKGAFLSPSLCAGILTSFPIREPSRHRSSAEPVISEFYSRSTAGSSYSCGNESALALYLAPQIMVPNRGKDWGGCLQ